MNIENEKLKKRKCTVPTTHINGMASHATPRHAKHAIRHCKSVHIIRFLPTLLLTAFIPPCIHPSIHPHVICHHILLVAFLLTLFTAFMHSPIYPSIHMHVWMYTCTHASLCFCLHGCLCVCMYVCSVLIPFLRTLFTAYCMRTTMRLCQVCCYQRLMYDGWMDGWMCDGCRYGWIYMDE